MRGRGPGGLSYAVTVAVSACLALMAPWVTGVTAAQAAVPLPQLVSQSPVGWTPNVFAGSSPCNSQWFGAAPSLKCLSTVYSEAIVGGEVVVAGAFTQACVPGTSATPHCAAGTLVTRDDIFAYALGTGTIDPNFHPVLDKGPVFSVIAGPPGSNTVYIGGQFTSVNGAKQRGIAQLTVTPAAARTDGKVVSAFAGQLSFGGQLSNYADQLALSGSALYVGGQFLSADSTAATGIVRLKATTGAIDPSFKITLSNPEDSAALKVEAMALSPDGKHLAIAGTFLTVNGQSRPRLAIIDTGGGLGATAALANFTAPILANNCSAEHDYVRGIDFSPDGSFFVIATTGFRSSPLGAPNICDAAARFNLDSNGTATGGTDNVSPAWINYTGGDSLYAVAITGGTVYLGGHYRWVNNQCGVNSVCEPDAVLENGVAALDSRNGMDLPWWHPQTGRAHGVLFLATFPAGLYAGSLGGLLLGTSATTVAGRYHGENALFPLASSAATTPGGPIPSGLFNTDGGSNQGHQLCVNLGGSASGSPVQIATCLFQASQNWAVPAAGSTGQISTGGLCLDTSGANVVANTCISAASQQWAQAAGGTLVNQATGLCLTDPNSSLVSPTPLQVAACSSPAVADQVWPLPSEQAPPPPPPVGPVSSDLKATDTQVLCLDDAGGVTTTGNKIDIFRCNGTPAQNWTAESDGTVRLHGTNCLDTSGTNVVLNPCNGSLSQVWQSSGPNDFWLVNKASGLCLADPGTSRTDGTQLVVATCIHAATNEVWRMPAV